MKRRTIFIILLVFIFSLSAAFGDSIPEISAEEQAEAAKKEVLQQYQALSKKQNRDQYSSDATFGNFREVKMGRIAEEKLYRSANPFSNDERGFTIDHLMKEHGISAVMDMAYTVEQATDILAQDSFRDSYLKELFDEHRIWSDSLSWNYFSEEYEKQVISGFEFLAKHEPPFLLHCSAGRDRTGFAVMILAILADAEKEDIIADYMITWENCYGVERGTALWDYIRGWQIEDWMDRLIKEYGNPGTGTIKDGAWNYLYRNGMNPDLIDQLIRKMTL